MLTARGSFRYNARVLMIQRHYLVIGAGPAGDAVCESIRKHDKKGLATLVGNEVYAPYRRDQLSKGFLTAKKPAPDALALREPGWYAKHGIELRLGRRVVEINLDRRIAVLDTGIAIEFAKACIATGSRPRRPMVAGVNLGNILYPRNLNGLLAMREIVETCGEAVVIGGGLLAAEICSSLTRLKRKTRLLLRSESLWDDRVDPETARWLTSILEHHGIIVMARESLNGFEGKTVLRNIQTKSGHRFPAELAIVAIGAEPNLELVQNTPLSSPNGTPVNELLETEEKGVFAAGDIALHPDRISGTMHRTEHWQNAREQGLVAGANMTGRKRQRFSTLPRYDTHIFDLDLHFIGDFSRPNPRCALEGSREKHSFIARYYQGDRLVAALLCNRKEPDLEKVTAEFA